MCSANNEPTELLFGDALKKHVKDLTMTNILKRSESYYKVTRNISSSIRGKFKTSNHESTEFVSPTFMVKKPDGGTRLVLNLKELNQFVKYEHCKMDIIKTIINMVTRNCFMATRDLKDAYYSVAISSLFQKFLKFKWKEKLYC